MSKVTTLKFLSAQGLLSDEIEYCGDEDGNIQIHQSNNYVTLTPRQCLDLRELLTAHLDVLNYVRSTE